MWEDRSSRYKNLKKEKNVTDQQASEGNNTTSVPQTTSAHEKYSRLKNVQNIHVQLFKLGSKIFFIILTLPKIPQLPQVPSFNVLEQGCQTPTLQ